MIGVTVLPEAASLSVLDDDLVNQRTQRFKARVGEAVAGFKFAFETVLEPPGIMGLRQLVGVGETCRLGRTGRCWSGTQLIVLFSLCVLICARRRGVAFVRSAKLVSSC